MWWLTIINYFELNKIFFRKLVNKNYRKTRSFKSTIWFSDIQEKTRNDDENIYAFYGSNLNNVGPAC